MNKGGKFIFLLLSLSLLAACGSVSEKNESSHRVVLMRAGAVISKLALIDAPLDGAKSVNVNIARVELFVSKNGK